MATGIVRQLADSDHGLGTRLPCAVRRLTVLKCDRESAKEDAKKIKEFRIEAFEKLSSTGVSPVFLDQETMGETPMLQFFKGLDCIFCSSRCPALISSDFWFSCKDYKGRFAAIELGIFRGIGSSATAKFAAGWERSRKRRRMDADAIQQASPRTRNVRAVALEPMPQKIQITTAGAAVIAFV